MGTLREDLCRPGLELRETHISWVFLGPRRVYKVKKPVALGFLDFSSLEARHAACEAEVALNRRLAPEVYLGVVPITRDGDGVHQLDGDGEAVDWAVVMRRLSDADSAERRLREERLDEDQIEAVAARLARFHAQARCDGATSRFGTAEVIRGNVEENFAQTQTSGQRYLGEPALDEVQHFQLHFLDAHEALLERRIEQQRIRDGHGDLRLEHVYLVDADDTEHEASGEASRVASRVASDDGCGESGDPSRASAPRIRIIDCIEFNHRFRYADVCADLAFLSMDLRGHEAHRLAELLLAAYARESDDYDLYALVDFYESYRAYVRAKVSAMLADDQGAPSEARERAAAQARRCFLLAQACERKGVQPQDAAPRLCLVAGMVASGKSTLGRALSRRFGVPVASADRTRKALAGVAATDSLADAPFSGAYTEAQSARVYAGLRERARAVLSSGRSVILDASFRARQEREHARALAVELGVDFTLIECSAPREVVLERLHRREGRAEVSDARADLLDAFIAAWQPIAELDPAEHLPLDTSGDLADNLARAARALGWS